MLTNVVMLTSCVYPAERDLSGQYVYGVEPQTAERQAVLTQEFMDEHGSADGFSAVTTDSAES
jgi:hypothetical protein